MNQMGMMENSVAGKMIAAIHHAALRVKNLEEGFSRWAHTLGLHGELHRDAQGDHGILRCTHEDYALLLIQGDTPGLEHVCYELVAGLTLSVAAGTLKSRGVNSRIVSVPHRGSGLELFDVDGNKIILIERKKHNPNWPSEVRTSKRMPGFHPRKFGHVNYLTEDAKRAVNWYHEILEFGVTDWMGDEGCWMHVNSDHHVLAFVEKGYNHIHHVAFELVDFADMRLALDHLAQLQRPVVWGPGRHGVARNIYSYVRMPEEEIFMELFCDLEQLVVDHEVRYFPDDVRTSNTWGVMPPRSYFKFDAESIQSEGEQTEAFNQKTPTPT